MEKFASGQESYQFYLKVSEKSEFFFYLPKSVIRDLCCCGKVMFQTIFLIIVWSVKIGLWSVKNPPDRWQACNI